MQETFPAMDDGLENSLKEYEMDDEENNLAMNEKEVFTAADLNNDGVLNLEEFYIFQSPEEHPQTLPIIQKQLMRDKDINGDGRIDFQEYVGSSGHSPDKSWLIVEKDRFDKDYDSNGDGFLTGNEVVTWITPNHEMTAKDEVDHLFETTDEDMDNRLSFEEILAKYETFVGSDATNYGDHLTNIKHFMDEL